MNEADFWKALRLKLSSISTLEYTRIESHMSQGVPDVAYSYNGSNGWIELKAVPDVGGNLKHFTQHQRAWLRSRWNAGGGHVWLFIKYQDALYIYPGNVAGSIKFPRSTISDEILRHPIEHPGEYVGNKNNVGIVLPWPIDALSIRILKEDIL